MKPAPAPAQSRVIVTQAAASRVRAPDARVARDKARAKVKNGIDPIEEKNVAKVQKTIEAVRTKTFDQCRDAYLKAHITSRRSPVHRNQWINSLRRYVIPTALNPDLCPFSGSD